MSATTLFRFLRVDLIDSMERQLRFGMHRVVDRVAYYGLINAPLRPLAGHDAMGGHTVALHVGKTPGHLRARLHSTPRLQRASAFWDEATARACVNHVISGGLDQVLHWLADPNATARLPLRGTIPMRTWVGVGIDRGSMNCTYLRDVRVILVKVSTEDFYVLTAYPD